MTTQLQARKGDVERRRLAKKIGAKPCQPKSINDFRVQSNRPAYGAPVLVYSMPASHARVGKALGHAGTHIDKAHEAERAATGLDWLLKGRKPERMNPVRAVVPVKALSWREDNKRLHPALKQKGGKK
jgi:hypothetical protein